MSSSSEEGPTRVDGTSADEGPLTGGEGPDTDTDTDVDGRGGGAPEALEDTRIEAPVRRRGRDRGARERGAGGAPARASAESTSLEGPALERSRATDDPFRSLSISTLRDTMQSQDAARTRGFVGIAAVVCVAMTLPLAFVGGDPFNKRLFAASMLVTAGACGALYLRLRDPLAYQLHHVLRVGYVSVVGAMCGIHYFGFFSPAPVVIPFGLYFFGLARSFGGTLAVLLLCAVGYAAMAVPIGLGWLPDRGLLPVRELSGLEVGIVVAAVEVIFFATYTIARISRRATEDAIAQHDRAIRLVAGREALLYEARMDLEGALRARGLGRFTNEIVGRYRLFELLGRGGMGEVYEARHLDSEEEVAVKLLHPHVLGDEAAVSRFMRECELLSRLDVPHVVKVVETSGPEEPIPFIAMERLRGTDLSDLLRSTGKMPMRDVLQLIREVGRGLDAAREANIVHRDIKPRNVFFAKSEGSARGHWKILDFGVGKLGEDEATLTQKNLVGTPSYMAPEQARGGEVTHRTDLYALGVIAYRALTGRPAFSAETPAAILYQVVNEMPPRPSELSPRLGDDVDLVLGIAMAKDPFDRFDSATELADMLERAAKRRLPSAMRDRARRVVEKHPWS